MPSTISVAANDDLHEPRPPRSQYSACPLRRMSRCRGKNAGAMRAETRASAIAGAHVVDDHRHGAVHAHVVREHAQVLA